MLKPENFDEEDKAVLDADLMREMVKQAVREVLGETGITLKFVTTLSNAISFLPRGSDTGATGPEQEAKG